MNKPLSERLEWMADHCLTTSKGSMQAEANLYREAAALARRVEGAPVAIFASHDVDAPPVGCDWDASIASVNGQRVALVPVETPPSTEGGEDGSR